MAWTDFFIENIASAKVVVSELGRPFVSIKIAPREYVEIHLTSDPSFLPFEIKFRRFDSVGELVEERDYAHVGTREIARTMAVEVSDLRLNSTVFLFNGE